MRSAIRRDYERLTGRPATAARVLLAFLADRGFQAVCCYRWAHACHRRGARLPARVLTRWMKYHCQVVIAPSARIEPGFVVRHIGGVIVGANVQIGPDCEIRQGVTLGGREGHTASDGRDMPVLEGSVSVGAGAKILGPVTIGANSTIGANAVVVTDIPANSVAVGVPARVIRRDGQKIPLTNRGDELAEALRDITRRLDRLERQAGLPPDSPRA